MTNTLEWLGELSTEAFLRDYWQQKPLFIANALTELPSLSAEQLAGYSLEDAVESRLIWQQAASADAPGSWHVQHGPFSAEHFQQRGDAPWSLLVQAVDQLHPEVHQLLKRFCFLPSWRLDDVMVSYASDGGSVGPHFDYYDVFLLQGAGERRWQLGPRCDSRSALLADAPLKILQAFESQSEYLARPGDLLYIPPNVAHWGVAEGESLTYSIGFRAPSRAEMLLDWAQEQAAGLSEDQRFSDARRRVPANPGELSDDDLARVQQSLAALAVDTDALAEWFGRYMTQAKRGGELSFEPDADQVRLAAHARAAYRRTSEQEAKLFINGESYACSLALAETLCAHRAIVAASFTPEDRQLIAFLREEELLN